MSYNLITEVIEDAKRGALSISEAVDATLEMGGGAYAIEYYSARMGEFETLVEMRREWKSRQVKKAPASYVPAPRKQCSACGTFDGMFTTLAGGNVCDDCL